MVEFRMYFCFELNEEEKKTGEPKQIPITQISPD
ncbi:MAG: hypothetical protein ACI8RD_005657 [Bacillariaceae sp.]|jgi:hypothetical protein